jgi:hypothetical protein
MSDHSESFSRPARPVVALSTTTMPSLARPISVYLTSTPGRDTDPRPIRVDFSICGLCRQRPLMGQFRLVASRTAKRAIESTSPKLLD